LYLSPLDDDVVAQWESADDLHAPKGKN